MRHSSRCCAQSTQLWFSIASHGWSSLLLVPGRGADALRLAAGLCEVSHQTRAEQPLAVVDATGVSLEEAAVLARQLAIRVKRAERVLVVVDPVGENAAALVLAARCDAALLCLALGQSDLVSARETIDRCGRHRFLGTALLRP